MGLSLSKLAEIDLTKGILEDVHVAFLIGAAKVRKITGILTLERNKTHKQIFFLEGLPVFCKSDLAGESLRQVLYKAGRITLETLRQTQEHMEREDVEEDRALLAVGALDDNTRYFHLQEQSRKRILSIFSWGSGCYSFEATEDFLDRFDLFDIDPLDIIQEGIRSHHVLNIAEIIQQSASEIIFLSENIEDYNFFLKRYFPDSNFKWDAAAGKQLGELISILHPEISNSMELAFILITAGALLPGGRRIGENFPISSISSSYEETVPDSEPTSDAPVDENAPEQEASNNPWGGDVESPDLQDEDDDIPEIITESQQGARQANVSVPNKTAGPPAIKKPSAPPPEAPWKKRREIQQAQKPIVQRMLNLSKKPEAKIAQPLHSVNPSAPQRPMPSASRTPSLKPPANVHQRSSTDPDLEKRFLKMLETAQRGNPFEILDVGEETTRAEIKKAYFYRHSQFHPDRKNAIGPNAEKMLNDIQDALRKAYDALLDDARRHEYLVRLLVDERKQAWSIELKKELAKKQFKRGIWFLSQRRPDLSFTFFDSAVNLDADQASYYTFLGWSQYISRKADAAASMAFIQTALGINSKYSEAFLFLGWINKDLGNEKKAVECFQHAVKFNPDNLFAKQELEKIGASKKKLDGDGILKRFFKK